jgi:hypothetical protein
MTADYPVDCPHCEHENDIGPDWHEGLGRRSRSLQWECEECGRWFDVHVEFEPNFWPVAPTHGPEVPWDHPSHPHNVWRRAQEGADQ